MLAPNALHNRGDTAKEVGKGLAALFLPMQVGLNASTGGLAAAWWRGLTLPGSAMAAANKLREPANGTWDEHTLKGPAISTRNALLSLIATTALSPVLGMVAGGAVGYQITQNRGAIAKTIGTIVGGFGGGVMGAGGLGFVPTFAALQLGSAANAKRQSRDVIARTNASWAERKEMRLQYGSSLSNHIPDELERQRVVNAVDCLISLAKDDSADEISRKRAFALLRSAVIVPEKTLEEFSGSAISNTEDLLKRSTQLRIGLTKNKTTPKSVHNMIGNLRMLGAGVSTPRTLTDAEMTTEQANICSGSNLAVIQAMFNDPEAKDFVTQSLMGLYASTNPAVRTVITDLYWNIQRSTLLNTTANITAMAGTIYATGGATYSALINGNRRPTVAQIVEAFQGRGHDLYNLLGSKEQTARRGAILQGTSVQQIFTAFNASDPYTLYTTLPAVYHARFRTEIVGHPQETGFAADNAIRRVLGGRFSVQHGLQQRFHSLRADSDAAAKMLGASSAAHDPNAKKRTLKERLMDFGKTVIPGATMLKEFGYDQMPETWRKAIWGKINKVLFNRK